MKTYLHLIFVILLIAVFLVSMGTVFAEQTNFVACRGAAIPDNQIDGKIGAEWNDACIYKNVPIDPCGTAQLWFKQDGTNLYIAMQFQADSSKPWVAFEFGSSVCMSTSADGALFGDSNYCPNGYADVRFNNNPGVVVDKEQDGVGAININGSNFVTVELKKPLNSGDTAENAINWTLGHSYGFLMEWNSNGEGSSGGSTSHTGHAPTPRTISLEVNPVPEFPSTTLLFVALIGVASLILTAKWRKVIKS